MILSIFACNAYPAAQRYCRQLIAAARTALPPIQQTSRLLSRVAYFPFEEFRCTGTNCYSFLAKSSFGVVRSCLKSHPQFMWIKDFNIVYCMSVRSSNLAHWLSQLSLSLATAEYSLFEETCEGEIHWSSGTPISCHSPLLWLNITQSDG